MSYFSTYITLPLEKYKNTYKHGDNVNTSSQLTIWNLLRLYFLICWVGTVMLPILHREVQRWNEEMLIKSLLHCLTHKEYSISNLKKKLFVDNHDLIGDSKQETGGENCCFQGTFYTMPDITGIPSWHQRYIKIIFGIFGPLYCASPHSLLKYFSVEPQEMTWLNKFLR